MIEKAIFNFAFVDRKMYQNWTWIDFK